MHACMHTLTYLCRHVYSVRAGNRPSHRSTKKRAGFDEIKLSMARSQWNATQHETRHNKQASFFRGHGLGGCRGEKSKIYVGKTLGGAPKVNLALIRCRVLLAFALLIHQPPCTTLQPPHSRWCTTTPTPTHTLCTAIAHTLEWTIRRRVGSASSPR